MSFSHSALKSPAQPVACGIDVLESQNFAPLKGLRVGLITNQTGLDRAGHRTVDLLFNAPDVKLTKLFSPEHGLFGIKDEKVGDAKDSATALPVYSLYGETRKPSDAMLADLDALVYDIQDVGVRYYTFESTMCIGMEAAAAHHLKYFVLDRPNPIRGDRVDGPLADVDHLNFVSYKPIPLMHGMTLGELAQFENGEYKIGAELHVIAMDNWKRDHWFDQTGLLWINPSPNMRNQTEGELYPCTCLLEQTNVSVGRGTDTPFETFGAPWIVSIQLAAALNGKHLPGLSFVPIEFTPAKGAKFEEQLCHGVYVIVTDRNAMRPVQAGLTVAWTLRNLFGGQFQMDGVNKLLNSKPTMAALKATDDPAAIDRSWRAEVKTFNEVRTKYLLYK